MKIHKILFVQLFVLLCVSNKAQSIAEGKQIVDTLTTKYFFGRGYVNDGLEKAANYLQTSFKTMGLQPLFKKEYLQPVTYSANSFPYQVSLSINNRALKVGTDFLITPCSKGVKTKGTIEPYDSTHYVDRDNKLVVEIVKKLTWSACDKVDDFTTLQILESSLVEQPVTYAIECENKYIKRFKTANIGAYIAAKATTDSCVIVSAHYDHLGGLGTETFFPGANDNASGVATLLGIAQYFTKHLPQHTNVVFVLFTGEEIGLKGSKYFVENLPINKSKIKFVINLDLEGTGVDGATVVNATEYSAQFKQLLSINEKHKFLPKINARGKAANSDHYWFSENKIPAFFMYTLGGIAAYHDVYDVAATLPLNNYENIVQLMANFIQAL